MDRAGLWALVDESTGRFHYGLGESWFPTWRAREGTEPFRRFCADRGLFLRPVPIPYAGEHA